VRPGDTLWRIAAGLLPASVDTAAVASLCGRLYDLNRAVIGDDPDLIRPGQRLRVPAGSTTAHREEEDR
jgi:nucleoid-associated protein YgaU